ncbi:isocitrate lyase/PEP mutase family protein [Oryzihumus sp.]
MTIPATDQHRRAQQLRDLHRGPTLLHLVNVWDVASALAVARVPGTMAIATASAAIAASHGYEDGENIPLDLHLAVLRRICSQVDLPVTADLEGGYGDVSSTVGAAIEAGVAGVNLEDDMCPLEAMQTRISDAVGAGRSRQVPIVINARTDVYLKHTDWDEDARITEAVSRGRAYLAAGADCVFVPGCVQPRSIAALVAGLGPGRLSLLAVPGLDTAAVQDLGVARLSHGPYPQRAALETLAEHARRAAAAATRTPPG